MSPVRAVARLLRPVCRLIERMVDGHAQERAEAKLRRPAFRSMRVNDIDIATEAEWFLAERDAVRRWLADAGDDAQRHARWSELDTDRRWAR